MAYTTLYCNEQMLLDNWAHYNEPNMMLKNTLRKTNLSPEECADFYLEHMHNREKSEFSYEAVANQFHSNENYLGNLQVINEINLYPQDFDYMYDAMWDQNISATEVKVLFGVIFMCRMFETPVINLDTKFRMRRFIGCYNKSEHLHTSKISGDGFNDEYVTITGLHELSDKYHLLKRIPVASIGSRFEYPEYTLHDGDANSDYSGSYFAPEYTYKVDLDTNKLNLSKAFEEAPIEAFTYCLQCKRPIKKKSNAQKYCPTCAEFNEFWRCLLRNNGIVKSHNII